MSALWILKMGGTFNTYAETHGDFEDWVCRGLTLPPAAIHVCRVAEGEPLPCYSAVAGAVITGSHAMVTDCAPWSEHAGQWLAAAVQRRIPILGICYGHQLLAHALGGEVRNNPRGREFGSVTIRFNAARFQDPLFGALPDAIPAHVCHTQSVVRLPPNATLLAASDRDPHQAFAVNGHAWGVQFHPEFNADAAREYICQCNGLLQQEGQDIAQLLASVTDTPQSAGLLRRFAELVFSRSHA